MYLKSIEIHGFKSFANKILFEFHDGITAIVGPNGSGKSNVADAVRWVLGEQSAKQLRGANMQDVIFSGSEARKPLGYAYVAITFDNSDQKLPIAFNEVSIARRVYRSGESEYLINGNNCRLKDVQEMFMDTGIGKEGYSIIGQGQIDRILSTKPEERRELFDEAVGIVKFKKRKALAEKNLEEEKQNLARITDITSEIEKQLEPLKKQSDTAHEYLKLKEQLKNVEVNQFLLENEKNSSLKTQLDEKYDIVNDDLKKTREDYENSKTGYERLEASLDDYNKAIEEGRSIKNEIQLSIEKREGEIKVLEQQITSLEQNSMRIEERAATIADERKNREAELREFNRQKTNFDAKLIELTRTQTEANQCVSDIREKTSRLKAQIEEANSSIMKILGDNGNIKTDTQRYETILEQNTVRKAELTQRLIHIKSDESDTLEIIGDYEKNLKSINLFIDERKTENEDTRIELKKAEEEANKLADIFNETQKSYIGEKSRLESMRNIVERYEGYGSTVKKIMEVRDRYPGINGVVADLISVDKKYETAVEVALGASIQHIVTDNETTAKDIIEYLKNSRLGRATFLPISSVGKCRQKNDDVVMKETGVIGDAASLVSNESRYNGIINHLLKNFIIIDNIDNALKLAKKYDYSLRIVTLDGEQLNPGGSISGGTYRNASSLLGRKRELEEIEKRITVLSDELKNVKSKQEESVVRKRKLRESIESISRVLQQKYVEQNTVALNLSKEQQRLREIRSKYQGYISETDNLDKCAKELQVSINRLSEGLEKNSELSKVMEETINVCNSKLLDLKTDEDKAGERAASLRVEYANIEQAGQYAADSVTRVLGELGKLSEEEKSIEAGRNASEAEKRERIDQIMVNKQKNEKDSDKLIRLEGNLEDLINKKEKSNKEHKSFLDKWDGLSRRVNELDKESFRLQSQREKLQEQIDYQISYIWQEYKLTLSSAEEYKNESINSIAVNKKEIAELKNMIKALGDVNVNAIEDYKNISERYTLYTSQKDDLIKSEETIQRIINELDEEMRKQFTTQFELIKREFNVVFRELFGGGKGELELIEEEDILEAGIKIIAQPPGKKLQNMMQLSGGEKALTAIALLFAIQNLKPSPFCLLDEIEAALDDSNVKRYASYLKKLTKSSQFIVITHRRGTMAAADILYGITMQEKGVSTLVSVNLIENDLK